jgi:hypothetical protein
MKISFDHTGRSERRIVHGRTTDPSLRLQMHGRIRSMDEGGGLLRRMLGWLR